MSDTTVDELERAHRVGRPIGRFMERWRHAIHRRPWLNVVYRALITVLGTGIVLVGLVLVPLPGPGWLIVFIGLTILGSEYHWARRLTSWLRMKLTQFWEWWKNYRPARAARTKYASDA